MKPIRKIGTGKFAVKSADGSELKLDFNPILNSLSDKQKKSDFQLIHWQGRPKGDREWGIYDPKNDTYRCGIFANCPTAYGAMSLIMMDDSQDNALPSAVLWFSGSLPV